MARRAIQLSSLCLDVRGVGNLNVQQIKQGTTYTLLMSSFPTRIYVYPATSVTGSLNRELIRVGDSVHFSTGPNEVSIIMASCWLVYQVISYVMQGDFGLFVASFSVREGGSYCIEQLFEPMDSFGIPITNDYDCPLLSLTYLFHCIPAHCILQSVSLIHECSPTCNNV